MRRLHSSIAERYPCVVHALDTEQLNAPQRTHDIQYRIDSADFVEMQFVRSDSMYCCLDRRDRIERRMRTLANFFRNRNGINQSMDLRNRAPMRLRRNLEVDLHTLDRRSLHLGDAHVDPIESEGRRQSRKP